MTHRRFLDIDQFYTIYHIEIDNLYSVAYHNLIAKGIRLANRDEFYKDFVNYVYKYSYKYE